MNFLQESNLKMNTASVSKPSEQPTEAALKG